MWKFFNKQTVFTFILTAMIFTGVGVLADMAYRINPNPYPVIVNGIQAPVEGLNINDYTFLKLSDIGKLLGIKLTFNELNSQIEITTVKDGVEPNIVITPTIGLTPTSIPVITPEVALQPEIKEVYKNGILGVEFKGIFYIGLDIISNRYTSFNILTPDDKSFKFVNMKNDRAFLFEFSNETMVVWYKDKYYFNCDSIRALFDDFKFAIPDTTPDGFKVYTFDGITYIRVSDIADRYSSKSYTITTVDNNKSLLFLKYLKNEVLIDNSVITVRDGYYMIEYNFYINYLLPVLK